MLAEADQWVLVKLRDAINVCMSKILRKPLQPLSQNIPSSVSLLCATFTWISWGLVNKMRGGGLVALYMVLERCRCAPPVLACSYM